MARSERLVTLGWAVFTFVGVTLYCLLWIRQGIDATDEPANLTRHWLFLHGYLEPGSKWFSRVLVGLWLELSAPLGLFGARLGWALIQGLSALAAFGNCIACLAGPRQAWACWPQRCLSTAMASWPLTAIPCRRSWPFWPPRSCCAPSIPYTPPAAKYGLPWPEARCWGWPCSRVCPTSCCWGCCLSRRCSNRHWQGPAITRVGVWPDGPSSVL